MDVASAQARRLPGIALNGMFGSPCERVSDSQSLICKTVAADRGPAPTRNEIPTGAAVPRLSRAIDAVRLLCDGLAARMLVVVFFSWAVVQTLEDLGRFPFLYGRNVKVFHLACDGFE